MSDSTTLFTSLWTSTQPTVTAYLACHLRDATAVDDLVQETALTLLRSFDRFDKDRDFTALGNWGGSQPYVAILANEGPSTWGSIWS